MKTNKLVDELNKAFDDAEQDMKKHHIRMKKFRKKLGKKTVKKVKKEYSVE